MCPTSQRMDEQLQVSTLHLTSFNGKIYFFMSLTLASLSQNVHCAINMLVEDCLQAVVIFLLTSLTVFPSKSLLQIPLEPMSGKNVRHRFSFYPELVLPSLLF